MGRRKKKRCVKEVPVAAFFKPQGIPMRDLERQMVSVEGFEALRLVDCKGMPHVEAAQLMGISRPTLSRVLSEARKQVATALTNGWAIQIEGGEFHYRTDARHTDHIETKTDSSTGGETMPGRNRAGQCGQGQGQGRGQGQGQGRGMGQGQGRGQGGGMQRRQTQGNATASVAAPDKQQMTKAKIAVSSEGPTLNDRVDPRFGRAGGFLVVDLETQETRYVDNGASQVRAQGAGIQAAQTIADAGATVLLTGYVGPKAFSALSAAGIGIGQDVDNMTVGEAIEKFKRGEVELAQGPNSQGGGPK